MTDRKEYMKEYHKQYRINNMDKIRAYKQAYAERKKKAIVEITRNDVEAKKYDSSEEEQAFNKIEYRKRYYEANKDIIKEKQRLRYENDENYKEYKKQLMRNFIKIKYKDPIIKSQICEKVKENYKNNDEYRNKVKERSNNKYHNDKEYRENLLLQKRLQNYV